MDYKPEPGDIINTEVHPPWWNLPIRLVKWAIQAHQKRLGLANPRHTHSMIYLGKLPRGEVLEFDPDQEWWDLVTYEDWILSVTFPKAKWVRWVDVVKQDWDAYRLYPVFSEFETERMRRGAYEITGTGYDVGQLLDIAANRILGIRRSRWLRIFDQGRARLVCSVGVRALLALVRRTPLDGLAINRTTPAHFASTPETFTHVGAACRS